MDIVVYAGRRQQHTVIGAMLRFEHVKGFEQVRAVMYHADYNRERTAKQCAVLIGLRLADHYPEVQGVTIRTGDSYILSSMSTLKLNAKNGFKYNTGAPLPNQELLKAIHDKLVEKSGMIAALPKFSDAEEMMGQLIGMFPEDPTTLPKLCLDKFAPVDGE